MQESQSRAGPKIVAAGGRLVCPTIEDWPEASEWDLRPHLAPPIPAVGAPRPGAGVT